MTMRPLKHSHRDGFTLIELLTVIGIMSLMMTLSVGTYFGFIASAKEAATRATILKVNGLIQDRVRTFRQYDFSDAAIRLRDAWNTNNQGDQVMTPELAEVLLRKSRFKQAFPQSFAEADRVRLFPTSFFPSLTLAVTAPYDSTFPTTYQSKYECGIVLHALLTRGETFGAPSAADDAFTGSEVRIGPETNNLPCLVDAWGEPLRFYRWPTRLIRCGEQDFDGDDSNNVGTAPDRVDDFNQNGSPNPAGGITASTPVSNSILSIGVAIRPYVSFPGPTPASLLISNLPPYDRTSPYAVGLDGQPGVANIDDDNVNGVDDLGEKGWPDSDDPEPLNTDPDDPTFRLTAWLNDGPLYNSNSVPEPGGISERRNTFVTEKHDFYTFHTPLIVSSGPDKELGLFEPNDNTIPDTFGRLAAPKLPPASTQTTVKTMSQLSDNITNLNQRAGGK